MTSRTAPVAARAAQARRTVHAIDDETWARLEPLIPEPPSTGRPRRRGRRPVGGRTVINTLVCLASYGGGFSSMVAEPGRYASGMTCWRRVAYWRQQGAWAAIAAVLAELPGVDLTHLDYPQPGPSRRTSRAVRAR
jgi:transposase